MPTDYRAAIAAYIEREAKPVEKFGHQTRVYALACQVGAGQQYDDDVVYAAAWLHDLGVFVGHRPGDPDLLAQWDCVAYAAERASDVLEAVRFPTGKIAAVVDAIRTHQPHSTPSSIEGIIVRDADILEQLGAIGILRQVCKVGRDTRYPSFTPVVASLRKALNDLPGQLRLETSRALASQKVQLLSDFLRAVDAEDQGALL